MGWGMVIYILINKSHFLFFTASFSKLGLASSLRHLHLFWPLFLPVISSPGGHLLRYLCDLVGQLVESSGKIIETVFQEVMGDISPL